MIVIVIVSAHALEGVGARTTPPRRRRARTPCPIAGRGPAVLLALRLRERRDRDRPPAPARRPRGRPRGHGARAATSSTASGCPTLGGKMDAIPGIGQPPAPDAGRGSGSTRAGAPSSAGSSTPAMDARGRGDASRRRSTAGSRSRRRSRREPRRGALRRASARSATSPRRSTRRTSSATRPSATPSGCGELVTQRARRRCRAVGRGWTEAEHEALAEYVRPVRAAGGGRWQLGPSRVVYPLPWHRGRVASWVVTTDHKRIGILYIVDVAALLRRGRHPRAPDPHAADPGEHGPDRAGRRTTRSSRCTARRWSSSPSSRSGPASRTTSSR